MKRAISALSDRAYDLVIVGGGIYGVCAAWDAALRGLSVAIIEKSDFCQATSANHYKLVHGGIRYLQHADLVRVRQSSRERAALLKIASHLVHPLPIVIPTYGHGLKGKIFLMSGFAVYDLLTLDRNRNLQDTERQIPDGGFLPTKKVLEVFPNLPSKGLTGGAVLNEGQYYNPPRLAISFLRSAVEEGADAANYVEATDFIMEGNRVSGVMAKDCLTQNRFNIRGKMVLVTAGPWSHRILNKRPSLSLKTTPTFSRDLAFVVKKSFSTQYGLACSMGTGDQDAVLDRGGRHVFLSPWRGHTLVGVWHKVFEEKPDEVSVKVEEIQGYLDEVNLAYPALALTLNDVSMINTGLTLFGDKEKQTDGKMSFGKRSLIIDHNREDQVEGLVTLIGVRATMARGGAEKAIDLVCKKLNLNDRVSKTEITPIFGGKINYFKSFINQAQERRPAKINASVMEALARNYGSEYPRVLNYAEKKPALYEKVSESTTIQAEVKHAVQEEMAITLADVVFRRTDLGTCGFPGNGAIQVCAGLMAEEHHWSDAKKAEEIQKVQEYFHRRGFLS